MSQFLDMGGYALYVWPAYTITFVVVALNVVWARRLLSQARAAARRRLTTRGEGT
jgi:heme exporter protein CcmD